MAQWLEFGFDLVQDRTVHTPGFDLLRRQWCTLNRFRTNQGHCGTCHKLWGVADSDLCACGATQTIPHSGIMSPDESRWWTKETTHCWWRIRGLTWVSVAWHVICICQQQQQLENSLLNWDRHHQNLKGVLQRTFFISTNERLMYKFYKNCNYFIFK